MEYEVVIGLEVHCQLSTRSKIFCGCSTTFGNPPNSQTCPICLGHPGVLPVLNRKVVESAVMMGLATHCAITSPNVFSRKHYFYPDLPKGYQISQYDKPICEHGRVEIVVDGVPKRIGLTRIHMEEDAGKNLHEGLGASSHVDLNRAGVPLLEAVSEPDLRSPDEAVAYLKKLRNIVLYLGICDGNMERGNFRCDANISLRPRGTTKLGTKVEMKNMNSFRFLKQALEYEIKRQGQVLDEGGKIIQETRQWDTKRGVTESMRVKEEAHDYRYMPEPDLAPVVVEKIWAESLRKAMPELPDEKRERFVSRYGLSEYDADVLTASRPLADYYEAAVTVFDGDPKATCNWVMGDLSARLNEAGTDIADCPMTPGQLGGLVKLIHSGEISGKIAKTVFADMYGTDKSAAGIVKEKGLVQVSDTGAIDAIIDQVIAANPGELEAYRGGKDKLFGFFVGQVMKASKGQANPGMVNERLKEKLKG
ncbi:MAG: Asp-tRNA(Asn)/Glu-tRNA(Gln) amidotransferase subunit GatB [Nitrospirota bacterium]|nr:Asp-tRNA(Asn)/Glu-tRNA(Gln) amidotransferase subunit GatB [Nitrospirota bacterium]